MSYNFFFFARELRKEKKIIFRISQISENKIHKHDRADVESAVLNFLYRAILAIIKILILDKVIEHLETLTIILYSQVSHFTRITTSSYAKKKTDPKCVECVRMYTSILCVPEIHKTKKISRNLLLSSLKIFFFLLSSHAHI
jgi:hypothetical protein